MTFLVTVKTRMSVDSVMFPVIRIKTSYRNLMRKGTTRKYEGKGGPGGGPDSIGDSINKFVAERQPIWIRQVLLLQIHSLWSQRRDSDQRLHVNPYAYRQSRQVRPQCQSSAVRQSPLSMRHYRLSHRQLPRSESSKPRTSQSISSRPEPRQNRF